MKYLALLRGINVGGKNIIKMVKLKATFEELGFKHITTYIQSGNVMFEAPKQDLKKLTTKIERGLLETFHYAASAVVITDLDLQRVVKQAPKGFGQKPDSYRYDVMFLKSPLRGKDVIQIIPHNDAVDTVIAGTTALYYSRLISKATQSRLSKVASMPIYQQMTIRNWNTTTKLLLLMSK